jgi:putative ABC transport system permease protein
MRSPRQVAAILSMNVLALTQRFGLALTIVLGIACAVGVLVSMLAMGVGARREAMGDVRPDRVFLTSPGAQSAVQSNVPKDVAYAIRDIPGIRKGADDRPIAVFEALVMVEGRRSRDGGRINFPLFGVSAGLDELRPELRVTAGRMFKSGLHEMIASDVCAAQYTGFGVGDQRPMPGGEWRVVGHFAPGRTAGSCVLYADANSIMSAFSRDSYNRVSVMLDSGTGFETFQAAVSANPTLHVEASRESEVVAAESRQFTAILDFASYIVGIIMATGATLGAANSLYALVDTRRRELATLRAIGFGSGSIVVSLLGESLLLAALGALLGSGLAWMFFNGLAASPFGVSFRLSVTSTLVGLGVAWALVMGLLGGILPALRAVRMPVTTALRAL